MSTATLLAEFAALKRHDPNAARTGRPSNLLTVNVPAELLRRVDAALAEVPLGHGWSRLPDDGTAVKSVAGGQNADGTLIQFHSIAEFAPLVSLSADRQTLTVHLGNIAATAPSDLNDDERRFLLNVVKNPGGKHDGGVPWPRLEKRGLIRAVGSWKWEPVDEMACLRAVMGAPASPAPADRAALVNALRMIEWSNDSAWQSQCAREALAAAHAPAAVAGDRNDAFKAALMATGRVANFDTQGRPRGAAPSQASEPGAWKLVPVEPTDAMVQATHKLDLSYMPDQWGADRAAVFRAMLAAAPEAPGTQDGEALEEAMSLVREVSISMASAHAAQDAEREADAVREAARWKQATAKLRDFLTTRLRPVAPEATEGAQGEAAPLTDDEVCDLAEKHGLGKSMRPIGMQTGKVFHTGSTYRTAELLDFAHAIIDRTRAEGALDRLAEVNEDLGLNEAPRGGA